MQPEEKDLFGNPIAPAPADCLKLKQFQVSGKIIKLPFSVWKDGRMRVDVSAFGKGEVVSRNKLNLTKRVREILAIALAETDELIAAGKFDPQPRERNKRVECSSEVSEAAGQLAFFRPADYKGLFSNCPGPVDSMLGPTHLEKRLFGLAWAKAVYTRLDFYELSLSKAARELGATRHGIKEAAYSLRDRWRLFWFENIRLGRFGGAVVRFPRQDWMRSNGELCYQFGQSNWKDSSRQLVRQFPRQPRVEGPREERKEGEEYNGPDWK
jgi:hypothetical protein